MGSVLGVLLLWRVCAVSFAEEGRSGCSVSCGVFCAGSGCVSDFEYLRIIIGVIVLG